MSSLKLLSDYYISLINSERIYNQYIKDKIKETSESSLTLTKETVSLQKQVQQLSVDLAAQKQENEKLKELQKNQKALLENAKKTITKLKGKSTPEKDEFHDESPSRSKFHLLSPIIKDSSHTRIMDNVALSERPVRLRNVLNEDKVTLFDDNMKNIPDQNNSILFISPIKNGSNNSPSKPVILRTKLTDSNENNNHNNNNDNDKPNISLKKKRKLSVKRIQTEELEDKKRLVLKSHKSNGLFNI